MPDFKLGQRNPEADWRRAANMARNRGLLTRSALDTWDALTTLHYGGREGICSHFREGTVAETGMAWALDAGVFSVPGTVTLANSILACAVSARAFIYQPMDAANTYNKKASVTMLPASAGDYVGLRLDDGSDNNYLEVVLYCSQFNTTQFMVRTRRRTGGGGVSTQDGDVMSTDPGFVLWMLLGGTKWTAWNAYPLLATNMGFGGLMYKPQTYLGTANLAFTPTRAGVSMAPGAQDTFIASVDWFDIGRV